LKFFVTYILSKYNLSFAKKDFSFPKFDIGAAMPIVGLIFQDDPLSDKIKFVKMINDPKL